MEENKEMAILQAAEEEFLEKGFDGARTVSIAQKAGVTHAMLHYYFRTKEQLFQKILDEKMDLFTASVLSVISDTEKPLLERLEAGIRRHFDFLAANPGLPGFIIGEARKNGQVIGDLLRKKGLPLISQTQFELDALAAEGKIARVDAVNLLLDVVSQNVFPFIVLPIAGAVFEEKKANDILATVKEENVTIIKKRLQV